jgi:hypothetical protein
MIDLPLGLTHMVKKTSYPIQPEGLRKLAQLLDPITVDHSMGSIDMHKIKILSQHLE